MPPKAHGAEVIRTYEKTLLARTFWSDGGERGTSLRIVRPFSLVERTLFRNDRLSPGVLKRVSLIAYLLIPVLIFLNTVVPQIPGFPYLAVMVVTLVLFGAALTAGLWFFFGASTVDRLQGAPLTAMKAPAVPAPQGWADHLGEVTEEAVTAYQRAFLAREVIVERISDGHALLGRFIPSQESYGSIEQALAYLYRHERRLSELLGSDSLDAAHVLKLRRVSGEVSVPLGVIDGPVADEVRDWVRAE